MHSSNVNNKLPEQNQNSVLSDIGQTFSKWVCLHFCADCKYLFSHALIAVTCTLKIELIDSGGILRLRVVNLLLTDAVGCKDILIFGENIFQRLTAIR
jgi:hypothetical protein